MCCLSLAAARRLRPPVYAQDPQVGGKQNCSREDSLCLDTGQYELMSFVSNNHRTA